MLNEINSPDEATIFAADYSMQRKLGGASLDKILSPEAIKEAEKVIAEASGELYADCVVEVAKLQAMAGQLKDGSGAGLPALKNIVSASFSAKTKAGLAGFDLVASLAKSLQILCERNTAAELTSSTTKIIDWHVQSISQLLSLKIKGCGGEAGKDILAEIEKYASPGK